MDKKIISTGALKVYKQKKYKTVEEVSVKANLRIAVIAVVISVISVIIGNLLPLFQKQETEYLDEISNKISALEEMFKEDNRSSKIIDEITELQNELTIIEEKMPERVDKLSEKEKGQSREKMAPR